MATGCSSLLHVSYKRRHDEVVRYIHHKLCRRYGLAAKRIRGHRVQSVVRNATVKIVSDIPIDTRNTVPFNRPDLVVHDFRAAKIRIIEIGITNRNTVGEREVEKSRKYELLAGELRSRFPDTEVSVIPIVLAWDGAITKHFEKHAKAVGLSLDDIANIQVIALKRTLDMVRGDHFENPEGDDLWMDQGTEELPGAPEEDEEDVRANALPPAPPDPPDPPAPTREEDEGDRVTDGEETENSIYITPPQTRATTTIVPVEGNTPPHTHTYTLRSRIHKDVNNR